MSRKTAALTFVAACVVIAALLLAGRLSPIAASLAFAVALLALGAVSRGFTG